MSPNTRKLAVLRALQAQEKPLDLPSLLQILGSGFAERSVRRWLHELSEEGTVEKTGRKRGTRYRAIYTSPSYSAPVSVQSTEPTTISEPAPLLFSTSGAQAIAYVRQPLYHRRPVTYRRQWFDDYQPNQNFYLSASDRQRLRAAATRAPEQEPAGTYARKIYDRLLIDLSYNSSRLEGNTYSLIDTRRLLIEGMGAEGKLDTERVMILNHKEAIRHLVDSARKLRVDYNEVCTLHYLLSDGLVPTRYAGSVRDHGVRIGASTYTPIDSAIQLERMLRAVCEKAVQIKDACEQSFFLLVHIAYLQAFTDVNKRTSRLSANIPLIKYNLVPLSFNDVDKEDYASAMIAIYELNDVRPLAELYCFSYLRTCQQYDVTAEAVGFDEIRVRYRQQRREVIRQIILQELTGEAMKEYIQWKAGKLIPHNDQHGFIDDIHEDLREIGPHRIAGMGITAGQLDNWLQLMRR